MSKEDLPFTPLTGWRVLIPRAGEWGENAAALVREAGGEAVIAPLIDTVTVNSSSRDEAVSSLLRGDYDWLVVTSARTVRELPPRSAFAETTGQKVRVSSPDHEHLSTHDGPGTLSRLRIASVGPATSEALRAAGWPVDLEPSTDFSALGLLDAWPHEAPSRVLALHSALAATTLVEGLRQRGHRVDDIPVYTTQSVALASEHRALLSDARVMVLLTAGTVAAALAPQIPSGASPFLASIGHQTTRDAARAGLTVDVTADTHTLPGLLAAAIEAITHSTERTS